jgi:glycosyltransferase involved in cell wall biosynthesis
MPSTSTQRLRDGVGQTSMIIAINDLLVYGSAITRPTGIQRVASGLARELVERFGARCVSVSESGMREVELPSSSGASVAARLAEPALRALSKMPRSLQERARGVARAVLSIRARRVDGVAIRPVSGSWLLVLGAPWIAPGMAEAVRRSKERDGVRVCLLIHDLLPATSQRWFADAQGRAAKDDIDTLIAAADAIFTVSAEVATELETLYGKRATLLRPADPQLNHAHENAPVDLPFAERTILSVGTFHPRKNLAALVRIWDAWRDAPTLVLVGRRHPQDGEFFSALAAHPSASERIRLIHTADDSQLADLYRACRFLVMPSLAEGWGLPIREALMAGRPSIATDAVPAATGSPYATIVPAGDEAALSAAIHEWWESDAPERLSEQIAREFAPRSWSDVAAEVAAQLES